MCQPGHTVAKEVADGRKSLPEHVLSSPQVGVIGVGSSAQRPMPHTWSKGLALAKSLLPVPKGWCFISGFAGEVFGYSASDPSVFALGYFLSFFCAQFPFSLFCSLQFHSPR